MVFGIGKAIKKRQAGAEERKKKREQRKALEESARIGEQKRIKKEKERVRKAKELKEAEAAVRRGKAKARKKGRGAVAVGLVKKGVKVAVKEARKYEFVDGEEPTKRKPAKKKIVKATASKTKVFGGKRYTLQSSHTKKPAASKKRDALKAKGKIARVVSTVKGYSVYARSK